MALSQIEEKPAVFSAPAANGVSAASCSNDPASMGPAAPPPLLDIETAVHSAGSASPPVAVPDQQLSSRPSTSASRRRLLEEAVRRRSGASTALARPWIIVPALSLLPVMTVIIIRSPRSSPPPDLALLSAQGPPPPLPLSGPPQRYSGGTHAQLRLLSLPVARRCQRSVPQLQMEALLACPTSHLVYCLVPQLSSSATASSETSISSTPTLCVFLAPPLL
ncbi:uncharacterized protein LOC129349161 [Amphiprion ocellaris]|uniref:uncharacterized protein LOC129349161 n=1 Tax=Amphiprion ocellaris TaxID=80972 RepID=UPI002410EE20|nr:uncharacterized protein LOC129349161 [Amphiprion ocellaris]